MKKLLSLLAVLAAIFVVGCSSQPEGDVPKAADVPEGKFEFTEGTEGTGGGQAAPKQESGSAEPLPDEGH